MCSRNAAQRLIAAMLAYFALLAAAPSFAAPVNPTPTEAQVAEAVSKVKADPKLSTEQKVRKLKWAGKASERQPQSFPEWLAEGFRWLAESVRLLMWGAIAVLVAMLVVLIVRRLRQLERGARSTLLTEMPTHVRDLDIRPESLPDDIGAAALALWEQGEHRAALALLYRGLLSRLVHVHAVPIKASSTEGDCLDLAREHLPSQRVPYTQALIGMWQRAVYGAHDPQTEQVRAACQDFEHEVGGPAVAA